mmetsp:Transcript_123526/g.193843  ORF Transcript_123526/g.193843 Transcript_123526/m.193843 type:complete len:297 (-) Transcript_123526:38-928(-)
MGQRLCLCPPNGSGSAYTVVTNLDQEYRRDWFKEVAKDNIELSKTYGVPVTVAIPPTGSTRYDSLVSKKAPLITVKNWSTCDAVLHFTKKGNRVCALNFANGQTVGGGYVNGTIAQEEDLCRRTPGLYPSLIAAKDEGLYPFGPCTWRQNNAHKYSHVLFTPGVHLMRRGDNDGLGVLPESEQSEFAILSAAAPNLREGERNDVDLLYTTIRSIFIAPKKKAANLNVLILGAWGCGAFRGDPAIISKLFTRALQEDRLGHAYDEVHFALPELSANDRNARVFRETFYEQGIPMKPL